MNTIISLLVALWPLLLIIIIVRRIQGHAMKGRTPDESVRIEFLLWTLGLLVLYGTTYISWVRIIPALEKSSQSDQAYTLRPFELLSSFEKLKCVTGACNTETPTLDPKAAPTGPTGPTGPIPTPSSGDQLVRDYRGAFGITQCVFTADSGDDGGANIVALADARGVRCLVIAGDVIYPNGSSDNFYETVNDFMADRIATQDAFPGVGNHDLWRGYPDNLQLYWTAEELPLCQVFPYLPQGQGKCRYYRVVLSSDVEVFHFNSNYMEPDGNTSNSVQGQWLQAALASSSAKWKIVVTHEPPVSSCNHESSAAVRNLPLVAWGADALITGHCHQYERSAIEGLPVMVVGVGGESLYQFEKVNPYQAPEDSTHTTRYTNGQGALFMSANANELTFEFITTSGLTIDTLILSK